MVEVIKAVKPGQNNKRPVELFSISTLDNDLRIPVRVMRPISLDGDGSKRRIKPRAISALTSFIDCSFSRNKRRPLGDMEPPSSSAYL